MEKFQIQLLERLQLSKEQTGHCALYTNRSHPEYGYSYIYERENCYSFLIGNYTIPEDFSLSFDLDQTLLHFGNFYTGTTMYQVHGSPLAHSMPSSFLTVEHDLHGTQHWKKGDHYYGIEVLIYETYLDSLCRDLVPGLHLLSSFQENYTYRYLPESVYRVLEEMHKLSQENRLSPLMLECKILECLAFLQQEVCSESENGFLSQLDYGQVSIGKDRLIRLTLSDIRAVEKAHEIIRLNAVNPPTIMQLAATVGISVQKLKAVFRHQYHMTIGDYTTSVRMSTAARLLTATQMPVEAIAHQVGYQHSANFARMFRKTYGQTPNQFRHKHN
ncbi:MAG: AraC family transcriptional regulator [Eubacteriales bacterium]|nr:AraC family transcriptional regulator [Eubacteriales bacterium]